MFGEFFDFLLYCGREDILYVFLLVLMIFCYMLFRLSFIFYVGDLGLYLVLCMEYSIIRKDLFRYDKNIINNKKLN